MPYEWLTPVLLAEMIFFICMNVFWITLYLHSKNKKFAVHHKTPLVSILVPCYNKAKVVENTIKAVMNLDYPKKEIIVINDGSTDGTREICKNICKKFNLTFIDIEKNIGKAFALNEGIKRAKGEIIVTVDADSYPERDALKKLIPYFADPEVGAVAGTVKVKNAGKILTTLQRLEYFHQAIQRAVQGFFKSVMVAPGPLTAFRKDVLEKIGYFHGDTLVEDWDVTLRIHKAGYKVIANKDAVSYTTVPENAKSLFRQRVRWNRGGLQIGLKHYDVFFNRKFGMLGTVFFPLHILWMAVPFLILPTFLLTIIPDFSLQEVLIGLSNFVSAIINFLITLNFYGVFKFVEISILDFLDFAHFNFIRLVGLISMGAFFTFTLLSIKSVYEKFEPRDMKALIFITFYWLFLVAVFVYSFFLEVTGRERKW